MDKKILLCCEKRNTNAQKFKTSREIYQYVNNSSTGWSKSPLDIFFENRTCSVVEAWI